MSYENLTPAEATMFHAVFKCEDIKTPTLRDLNNFLSGKEVLLVPNRATVMTKFRDYIAAMNETHSSIQRRISLVMKTLGISNEDDIHNVTRELLAGTTVTSDQDGQEFHIPEVSRHPEFVSVTFGPDFVVSSNKEIDIINYVFSTSEFLVSKPYIRVSPDVGDTMWRKFRSICDRIIMAINKAGVYANNLYFNINLSGIIYTVWFETCEELDKPQVLLHIVEPN